MSVTAAKGFRAAGVAAGIKQKDAADLAVVVNDGPQQVAAGVFTTNRFPAAPVVLSRRHVADGTAHAVVLNSGGANACTGGRGAGDAEATAAAAAKVFDCAVSDVLVCSTGLIGAYLPVSHVCSGITAAAEQAGADAAAGDAAAHAIMTTDTHPKQACAEGQGYTVGGMAKGAGMLAPGLATMLVVITTDARIDAEVARRALAAATSSTFNRVDSDGCMSTNDTVLLLASGAAEASPDPDAFTAVLRQVCADLARQLVGDAEGSSHDIAVTVTGAASEDQAEAAARVVTRSNLFKAAIFGADPNWGRILSALGTLPADRVAYDPTAVDVAINGVTVCKGGEAAPFNGVDMAAREVRVDVELHAGDASATVWTNDLTYDYVNINSAYSS